MGMPPNLPASGTAPRRRKFNMPLAKSVIVLVVGALIAFGSAWTGLGAQVAFAPMLSWMLGFAADKAQGTALRYMTFGSLAAVIGTRLVVTPTREFLLQGLDLFLTATLGAVVAIPLSKRTTTPNVRRFSQTLGLLLTLFVLLHTSRASPWVNPHFAYWNTLPALALLGGSVGALTQGMGLAGGTLMVPALYYLSGFRANEAVALSLLVIGLASTLPAWSYARRGLVDTLYGTAAVLGGVAGGLLGGLLLERLQESLVLILFALVAMFFCARELARLAGRL